MASRGRLDAMPLGPGGGAEGYVHPVGPRCDKTAEAARPPVPPVPRTVRPKPKASSRGYMAREGRRDNSHVELCDQSVTPVSQCSETRRPREDSPFAYARKHYLSREKCDRDNQAFEMGPPRRNSEAREDYRRFTRAGSCPPPRDVTAGGDGELPIGRIGRISPSDDAENKDPMKKHARRSTLQQERNAADQCLERASECAPSVGLTPAELPSHARRRMLARENHVADKSLQVQVEGAETFGRVMGRRDGSAPPAVRLGQEAYPPSGADDAARYGRKNLLARDAHGSIAHEGLSFSRVMGR